MAFSAVRLRQAWTWGGLTTRQLMAHTFKEILEDEIFDRAADVAFFAMLALVPFLGFVLTIAAQSIDRAGGTATQLEAEFDRFLPLEAQIIVGAQIHKIQQTRPVGVLSFSFLVLLWSSSGLFVAVMDAINAAYDIPAKRAWWKRRLMGLVLTVVESILVIGALTSIVAWPQIMGWFGLRGAAVAVATVIQWLAVVVVLLASFAIAYYFSPNAEQDWEWITPGSALGVLILIVASLGFRVYVQYGSSYSKIYGALAGVVILLLWLYIAALVLLVGAEMNSVIEHAAPLGKSPGRTETGPSP